MHIRCDDPRGLHKPLLDICYGCQMKAPCHIMLTDGDFTSSPADMHWITQNYGYLVVKPATSCCHQAVMRYIGNSQADYLNPSITLP
jgi:hypothetical protein